MIDFKVLTSAGYSDDKLRKLFTVPRAEMKEGPKRLLELTEARIRESVNRNLENANWWWSIDQACDLGQQQISATMAKGLLAAKLPNDTQNNQMQQMVKEWGLSSMLTPVYDDKGRHATDSAGNPVMKFDVPVFVNVLVPLCLSYIKVRWATLFADRDTSPLLKYQPLVPSSRSKLKCDLITSRIERSSQDMGHRDFMRQLIFQTLKYGVTIAFAQEPYFQEKQVRASGGTYVVREGVRRALPHPSRLIYDLTCRLNSLNTSTGVRYAGYWDIYPWGDIIENRDYWFSDEERKEGKKIGSSVWLENRHWSTFNWLYPCTLEFPKSNAARSDQDRTSKAFEFSYSQASQGVVISNVFQHIVPKQFDLFDYDHPVWMQFVMAGDDSALLVRPFCYNPAFVALYDADQNLARNPSMAIDMLPFQDQIGNFLSQYIRTVRRNLVNLVFYNMQAVEPDTIQRLKAMGNALFTDLNFEGIRPREVSYADPTAGTPKQWFETVTFPRGDTQEIMSGIKALLEIVERIIGFTSQEIGSTGSHVQTAEEIRVIRNFTSARIALTDSFLDTAITAMKQQEYDAFMAYGDDVVFADVADLSEIDRAELKAMNFEVETTDERKAGVIGPKGALSSTSFASDREGARRTNDIQLANSMLQMFQSIFSNAGLVEQVGADKVIGWLNTVMQYAGIPRERQFKVEASDGAQPKAQQEQLLAQVEQLVSQLTEQQMVEVGKAIREEVIAPIEEAMGQTQQTQAAIVQRLQQLEQALMQRFTPQVVG